MKHILTMVLILVSAISVADFRDAQANYEQQRYKQAYKEFLLLAKLGNRKAQFNVAVMLANGQGVEQNLPLAYAWSKISDSKQKNLKLSKAIEKQLTIKEKDISIEFLNELGPLYSHEKSKVILGPVVQASHDNKNQNVMIIIDSSSRPIYPTAMARSGFHGWVKLNFYIYPDKSIRDIQVVENFPNKGFDQAAINSIQKYKFHIKKNGIVSNDFEPISASLRIDFKLVGSSELLNHKQKRFLSTLKTEADNGNAYSQYNYATIQDRYDLDKSVDQEMLNTWLFNAAQEGIADAQYRIGRNIFYGKSCQVEKQKGLDWIMLSAQTGNAYAQYMAYKMLENKKVVNQSKQTPFYWLEQSAKNGLTIAKLNYASVISEMQNPSKGELSKAKKYISDYAKNAYKTIQWYQVSALIDFKLGKTSKARSKIKSAYRMAKSYGWDIDELQQQKDLITNSIRKNS